MKINALAVHEKGAALKPFSYQIDALSDQDCIVKVIACGICSSDLSSMSHGFKFPLVPGHEVVGEVVELGANVHQLNVGDRCLVEQTAFDSPLPGSFVAKHAPDPGVPARAIFGRW